MCFFAVKRGFQTDLEIAYMFQILCLVSEITPDSHFIWLLLNPLFAKTCLGERNKNSDHEDNLVAYNFSRCCFQLWAIVFWKQRSRTFWAEVIFINNAHFLFFCFSNLTMFFYFLLKRRNNSVHSSMSSLWFSFDFHNNVCKFQKAITIFESS